MRTLIGFSLLAFLLVPGSSHGQQPLTKPADKTMTIDVVVAGKDGKPVSGLTQQDFTLLDNKTPQPIRSFRAIGGQEAPVHVILVVDLVNVPYEAASYERSQISKLLLENGGHLAYPTTLAFLTDKGMQIQQKYTEDGAALKTSVDQFDVALREIRRSSVGGGEERLDISLNALRQLSAHEAGVPGRKLEIWISPGWPLFSGPQILLSNKEQDELFATIIGVSTELRQSQITLYCVDPIGASESLERTVYYKSFLNPVTKLDQVDPGDLALQVLAVQSGGMALNSSNDLAGLVGKATEDAGVYYELSFQPASAERRGDFHQIEVRVDKPGLAVRTRQGYYPQP